MGVLALVCKCLRERKIKKLAFSSFMESPMEQTNKPFTICYCKVRDPVNTWTKLSSSSLLGGVNPWEQRGGRGSLCFLPSKSSDSAWSRAPCLTVTAHPPACTAALWGSGVCQTISLAFRSLPLRRISLSSFDFISLSPGRNQSVHSGERVGCADIQVQRWGT